MILSLWALLLLSAAIIAWIKFLDQTIEVTNQGSNGLDAKALAHSGAVAALHPQVTQLTPILNQQFTENTRQPMQPMVLLGTRSQHKDYANGRGYSVIMTGEGGRLNLNWLFTPVDSPDPGKLAVFKRYLGLRGLNLAQRDHLTDSIIDWLSPGNLGKLNGAEDSADYHPPHRGQFLSVDELAQVAGSAPLVSQSGWRDDFTIYTNPGLIDLQSASQIILESLPGVSQGEVIRFLGIRRGPDGIDGTKDDRQFTTEDALGYLGLGGNNAQVVSSYVTTENPAVTVHIQSTGESGGVKRRLEVVARKQGLQPIILSWKEL